MFQLEWWQAVVAIIGVLGLSPAPWLLGLANNRIQFTRAADAAHARELAAQSGYHAAILQEKDKAYGELKESQVGYKTATKIERERANKATDALGDVATTLEVVVHLLNSLDEAASAKDVAP